MKSQQLSRLVNIWSQITSLLIFKCHPYPDHKTGAWQAGTYLNFMCGTWTSTPFNTTTNTLILSHGTHHPPTLGFLSEPWHSSRMPQSSGDHYQPIFLNQHTNIWNTSCHSPAQTWADSKGNVKSSMRGILGGMRGTAWGRSQDYRDQSSGPESATQVVYLLGKWLHSSLVSADWIKIFHSWLSGSVNLALIFIKHSYNKQ